MVPCSGGCRLRSVFFGSADFSVPSLEVLAERTELAAVVTAPDRPSGRGMKMRCTPVKARALELGVPVLQPETTRRRSFRESIAALRPDVGVVTAYGRILGRRLLETPPLGFVNVHASLLPRWRGAAPIQRAILAGDRLCGVSLMRMTPGLDEGPVFIQGAVEADDTMDAGRLHDLLADLGARLLGVLLDEWSSGRAPLPVEQPVEGVTYAEKLSSDDERLRWEEGVEACLRRIRALRPWPLAHAVLAGRRVKVIEASRLETALPLQGRTSTAASGVGVDGDAAAASGATEAGRRAAQGVVIDGWPCVACPDGVLRLDVLKPAGRGRMSGRDFVNGLRLQGTFDVE